MNGLSTTAEGVNAALSAVTNLVAAGGPTLNLKMTSEKTAPAPSQAPSLAQSTSPKQPAAASAKGKKKKNNNNKKKDTLYHARENYKNSQRAFLESQRLYLELERKDKIANDEFNEIQLQLQRLCREDVSIVRMPSLPPPSLRSLLSFLFPLFPSLSCICKKWMLIWRPGYRNKL